MTGRGGSKEPLGFMGRQAVEVDAGEIRPFPQDKGYCHCTNQHKHGCKNKLEWKMIQHFGKIYKKKLEAKNMVLTIL